MLGQKSQPGDKAKETFEKFSLSHLWHIYYICSRDKSTNDNVSALLKIQIKAWKILKKPNVEVAFHPKADQKIYNLLI